MANPGFYRARGLLCNFLQHVSGTSSHLTPQVFICIIFLNFSSWNSRWKELSQSSPTLIFRGTEAQRDEVTTQGHRASPWLILQLLFSHSVVSNSAIP